MNDTIDTEVCSAGTGDIDVITANVYYRNIWLLLLDISRLCPDWYGCLSLYRGGVYGYHFIVVILSVLVVKYFEVKLSKSEYPFYSACFIDISNDARFQQLVTVLLVPASMMARLYAGQGYLNAIVLDWNARQQSIDWSSSQDWLYFLNAL